MESALLVVRSMLAILEMLDDVECKHPRSNLVSGTTYRDSIMLNRLAQCRGSTGTIPFKLMVHLGPRTIDRSPRISWDGFRIRGGGKVWGSIWSTLGRESGGNSVHLPPRDIG